MDPIVERRRLSVGFLMTLRHSEFPAIFKGLHYSLAGTPGIVSEGFSRTAVVITPNHPRGLMELVVGCRARLAEATV